MKRAAVVASLAAVCQPICAHAAAGGARVLSPSSAWTLDFADERCSLIREFGDGDGKVRLQIDSFGPTMRGYRVMISGGLVPAAGTPITDFRVGYSPDTSERERFTVLAGTFGEDSAVSFRQGFLPASPASQRPLAPQLASASPQAAEPPGSAFERSITHMTVDFGVRQPLRLETGSMAAPFAAMHRCVDDLMASWGVDPKTYRTLSRPAQFTEVAEGWTRLKPEQGDRPGYTERRMRAVADGVLRNGELIPVRVMIDAAGKPTACVVQVPFANEAYRQNICESFKGYSFRPALDAGGQPAASFILFDTR